MDTRRIFVSAVFLATLLTGFFAMPRAGFADSIGMNSYPSGNAVDGGPGYGWTIDGNFDALLSTYDPILMVNRVVVTRSQGADPSQLQEKRAAYEFTLPAVLTQPGVTITQATLTLPNNPYGSTTLTGNDIVKVYGYSADGQLTLSDFANIGTLIWTANNTAPPYNADVTGFVQSLLGNGTGAGFVVAMGSMGTYIELDANASLNIVYTAPANYPPTVSISSPAPNSQFAYGAPITFSATATDPENGVVGPISWISSISGTFGTGSQVTTSSLPAGTHIITAQATDNVGLTGLASMTITVGSATGYCTARGSISTYEWIKSLGIGSSVNISNNNGGYGDFVSFTQIPVSIGSNSISLAPGFASGSYTEYWRLWIDLNRNGTFDADEQLYSGSGSSTLSGTLTVPSTTATGPARMRVAMSYGSAPAACGNFSYGEVEDYTANITTAPPAPPPPPPATSYCASKGSSAYYEWINQVTLAGVVKSTGANGGYRDMTGTTPVALVRSGNSISLYPGFGSGTYTENWRAWIDFNQDKSFTSDEMVYSGSSSSTLNGSVTVPATALSGATRMRISMKYGSLPTACESFAEGEVEDYTVTIP